VVGVDVSHPMLVAARRAQGSQLLLVQASAFRLPFADGAFEGAVSGFVLRNLDDLPAALDELARVLAPGAGVALLDATDPPPGPFRPLFHLYFGTVAPLLGTLAGKRREYEYLARSLGQIPPALELCRLLRQAGFTECASRPLTGGAVTLFIARRGARSAGR
jgi:demethylmenaquinone methyltransferase/2-methoxy-6-polyprenyl-1,4-benzoquinol methylase